MAELITLRKTEQKVPQNQKRACEIIMKYSPDQYDEVLKNEEWRTFSQLSTIKEGLLNWYPFNKQSRILLISNSMGSLAKLFEREVGGVDILEGCEERAKCIAKRFQEYSNVRIFIGKIMDLYNVKKYDYVVVEKELLMEEEIECALEECLPLLTEEGEIFFTCENRFGAKYWCGSPDTYTNQAFGGLRNREKNERITQKLLEQILNEKQGYYKFYYPFPDAAFTQAVYTNAYLPKESIRDRVIPYYTTEQRESMLFCENDIWDDIMANRMGDFFANSFLIEYSMKEISNSVRFAAVSTDRGEESGFATVITEKEVYKKALYKEGIPNIQVVYQNAQELIAQGVLCVDQKIDNNRIIMPYVGEKNLAEKLRDLFLEGNNAEIERIFDELYEQILKSSAHISPSECCVMKEHMPKEIVGPILQKAYIDMIPYNCFYEDGKFLFYDQEFSMERFPAKYVLFRALRYMYIFAPEAENVIPLDYFKNKYGMSAIWEEFEYLESLFIEKNRNYEKMTPFYKNVGISDEKLDSNREKLRKKNETRQETHSSPIIGTLSRRKYTMDIYNKDIQLLAVKKVQCDLLRKFIEVCQENNLTYCAFYGTLLGAIRHDGFIPWDDDVDVVMPRKDYDKLQKIANYVFEPPYFLQTPENDNCFYGGYAKLRNSATTGIEERDRKQDCNRGIWIDIFPLDNVPANEKKKKTQFREILFYQRLLAKKNYGMQRVLYDLESHHEKKYLVLSKLLPKDFLCRRLKKAMTCGQSDKSSKVAVMARYYGGKIYQEYNLKDFSFLINHAFEGEKIMIPSGYENCLINDYGMDYMLYAPEEERIPHHKAQYDVKKAYTSYTTG